MSTPKRKWTIRILTVLFLCFLLCIAWFWQSIYLYIAGGLTENWYRKEYSGSTGFRTLITDDDLAWDFGGRMALPRLERLAADPELTLEGRQRAQKLYDYIKNNEHLPYIRYTLEGECPPLLRVLSHCILKHDEESG